MVITASFEENVVTKGYKTRVFKCTLQKEIDDNEDIQQVYDNLHIQCVKSVRGSMEKYIKSLNNRSLLQGGIKVQYVKMKGERYAG